MKARAIVTLSNENAPSRSRPSAPPAAPRQRFRRGRPRPPAGPFCSPHLQPPDGPTVLGLYAPRVDLTRRRNNRSHEREE
jgi:hypothetical protein